MDHFEQPNPASFADPPPPPPPPPPLAAPLEAPSYFPAYQASPPSTALPPFPAPPPPQQFFAAAPSSQVNAEAGPSLIPAVPVRPLKGPGSRGGRGSGRGRGRGGRPSVDSDYAINRPVRTRRPVQRSGMTASDDDDDDFYQPTSHHSHHKKEHHYSNEELSGKKIKFSFRQNGGKASVGVTGAGSGRSYNSFLGVYDRELDTDDDEIEFEEQFILRMPEGEPAEKLREMVKEKGAKKGLEDVWFKFKDSRRAVFKLSNQLYSAKLVDLPSIIESQKTLDGKQMFKAADISQMLVVSDPIKDESEVTAGDGGQGKLNIEDYIWPHGITPPLRHVRKRRFRKRISRRTIEITEQEVERMLEQDQKADKVIYDIIEDADPDASDSEFLTPKGTPAPLPSGSDFGDGSHFGDGSQMGDGATPRNGNGSEQGGDDLAAELARELENSDEDEAKGHDDNDEDDDDDDEDDDDDDEDDDRDDDDEGSVADSEDEEAVEIAQRQKLLNEEIRDLETAVGRKRGEIASSSNPIIKKRFEDALKKLQADLDLKLSARGIITKEKEKRKREDEEEKERELGLKKSAQGEADRLKNVAALQQPQPAPVIFAPPSLPPLPSMASSSMRANTNLSTPQQQGPSSFRPTASALPPPPSFLQHSVIQPSSLSNSFVPSSSSSAIPIPPPVPMPQQTPDSRDLDALLAAGLEAEDDSGDDDKKMGGAGGPQQEEDEEDLFGDEDDEDEDDDMEEI